MRTFYESAFYLFHSVALAKELALQPALPALALVFLHYAPTSLRDRLLRFLAARAGIQPRTLRLALRLLLGLGLAKMANRWLNKLAVNNWRLRPASHWHWPAEIAVVTGGSSGIGGCIVKGLASRGIMVVVLDVQELPSELKMIENVKYFSCDLTLPSAISQVAETVRNTIGMPSILINNAGISPAHGVLSTSDEYLQKIFRVNLLAHWATTREFLPNMLLRNKGHIVTVASLASFVTLATSVDYSATEAGALAFHEGLGCELRHIYKSPGVFTTVVQPSYVQTPMTEIVEYRYVRERTMLNAQEIADAVVNHILAGQGGGQLIFPGNLSLVAALRGWPTWMQQLARDVLSEPLVAGLTKG